MNKLSYTKAPFSFHKSIRYCFQYRIKDYTDNKTLHSFMNQFKGKTGLYCITTEEGVKIGITTNLTRRFKEHLTPMVKAKSISFLVFNLFPIEELRRVENMLKSHYSSFLVETSNEFFKGLDGFDVFNQAKGFLFKITSKRNRVKNHKTEFQHLQYKPKPKYTTTSKITKEALDDFYL